MSEDVYTDQNLTVACKVYLKIMTALHGLADSAHSTRQASMETISLSLLGCLCLACPIQHSTFGKQPLALLIGGSAFVNLVFIVGACCVVTGFPG